MKIGSIPQSFEQFLKNRIISRLYALRSLLQLFQLRGQPVILQLYTQLLSPCQYKILNSLTNNNKEMPPFGMLQ